MPGNSPVIEIHSFQANYAPFFKSLNEEWIVQYFEIEEMDIKVLNNPEEYIIEKGGDILFLKYDDKIVGTCALMNTEATIFELGKMAISPEFQGKGLGQKLAEGIISRARELGGQTLFLESNRKLTPAIRLYEKLGFREVPQPKSHYSRSDIKMEIDL